MPFHAHAHAITRVILDALYCSFGACPALHSYSTVREMGPDGLFSSVPRAAHGRKYQRLDKCSLVGNLRSLPGPAPVAYRKLCPACREWPGPDIFQGLAW